MGALNSVVDDDTKNIVIESANFNKNSIEEHQEYLVLEVKLRHIMKRELIL